MSEPKMLKDFLDAQVFLMKPANKVEKPDASIMKPEEKRKHPEPEDDFDFIITKKPAKKKVEKYLQGLVDVIMEENDV